MARFSATVIVVVTAIVLAACGGPPEFSSPLGPRGAYAPAHDRLAGIWVSPDFDKNRDSAVILHIRSDKEGGMFANAVYSTLRGSNPITLWWHGRAFATDFEGQLYVNFRRVVGIGDDYTPPGIAPGYSIAKIRFEGNDIIWVRLNPGLPRFKRLIEDSRIQGRSIAGYNRTGKVPYHYFPVTTAGLRRLLHEADPEKFFTAEVAFRRIRRAHPLPPEAGEQSKDKVK